MKKLIIILIATILAPVAINAATIKGYVYDKKTNEPIIGAIVTMASQNKGVQTDFQGRFTLKNVPTGTEQVNIKSLGYSDYNQIVTISDDNAEIDLGRIDLKTAKSKHYNRVALSYNPAYIPKCHEDGFGFNWEDNKGFSISYLHGYNFFKNLALEFGAKYNYSFNSYEEGRYIHSQSKHHSISILANLACNIPVKNVTIAPYLGLYMRKFIYSKASYGNENGCTVYDTERNFNNKWLNPGVQVGLGFKFKRFYIGGELSYEFDQLVSYDPGVSQNWEHTGYEYSVSLGYEF